MTEAGTMASDDRETLVDGVPIRVLVVDDSFDFRRGLARVLRREAGIQVVGRACNGQHAVRLIRRVLPEVVLMDLVMRGMDGIAATMLIGAEFPKVQVIGLSSFATDSEEAGDLKNAGAVAYICKGEDSLTDKVVAAIRTCRDNTRIPAGASRP